MTPLDIGAVDLPDDEARIHFQAMTDALGAAERIIQEYFPNGVEVVMVATWDDNGSTRLASLSSMEPVQAIEVLSGTAERLAQALRGEVVLGDDGAVLRPFQP